MVIKAVLTFTSNFRRRTPELDGAFHNKRSSSSSSTETLRCNDSFIRTSELDGAMHVSRRAQRTAVCPNKISHVDGCTSSSRRTPECTRATASVRPETETEKISSKIDDAKHDVTKTNTILHCTKPLPPTPSERYELKIFEQKYKAFAAATDDASADIDALFDDLYHDEVVHMMDGVAMNKSALQKFYLALLNQGTRWTVNKFQGMSNNHVESVVYTRNRHMDFCGHHLITLKDGKIIRVEKIVSAVFTQKTRSAKAA